MPTEKKSTKSKSTAKAAPKAVKTATAKKKATKPATTNKKATAVVKSDKFAVIKLGGTQLKVFEGGKYEVEKLEGAKGDKIEVKDVLLLSDGKDLKVGKPLVDGAVVSLQIDSQKKDDKVEVFKYKAKARYRKKHGHRQQITRVEVLGIK